ncbi:MAG: hypothetical protein ACRC6M_03075 [Microcystaceae cyanobacterium]
MGSPKPIKLDLYQDYPCPCRRRGRLVPIILTEALGCDRCQQIFVVDEKHQEIELVSSAYPYKQLWRWTGYRWRTKRRGGVDESLPTFLGLILVSMIGWLFISLRSPLTLNLVLGIMIAGMLLFFLIYLLWLVYRR